MKNKILKTATAISVIALLVSASMFDSEKLVFPTVVLFGSLAWLLLFALANEERMGK